MILMVPALADPTQIRARIQLLAEDPAWRELTSRPDIKFGIELKMNRLVFPPDGSGPHIFGVRHAVQELIPEDWKIMVGLPKLLGMTEEALDTWIRVLSDLDLELAVGHGGDTVGTDWQWDHPDQRYTSPIDSTQYLQAMDRVIEIGRRMTEAGIPLGFEITGLTQFYLIGGQWQPDTFCCPRIGMLPTDTNYLCQETGAVPVIDDEHGGFSINGIMGLENYVDERLWQRAFSARRVTDDDRLCYERFGFFFRRGELPYLEPDRFGLDGELLGEGPNERWLPFFLERFENLGHFQLGSSVREVSGGNITSHALVSERDERFRRILRHVLSLQPESLMVEAGLDPFGRFSPEILDTSIRVFGRILLEELDR
ncbi:MAG: hypothetical protein ABIB97_03665 [Patescibacteria group bacterium]